MQETLVETFFPIRELSRRTGVNASTLRAWESRHGLLKPARTASGHRLYSQDDVLRVRRVQELIAQGVSLVEVSAWLDAAPAPVATTPPGQSTSPQWQGYLLETLRALEDFSSERLDLLYNEACALYPIELVTQKLLLPVLEQLGYRWDKRESGIAEEHFFTAWLRNKLGARLHHSSLQGRGRPLVLACLAHENHEIGLLLCALRLLGQGQKVIYLGANMPIRQIVHVVAHAHAQGVLLAGRDTPDPRQALTDIAWLAAAVEVPVFVGSHYSVQTREALIDAGAIPLGEDIEIGLQLLQSHLAVRLRRPR